MATTIGILWDMMEEAYTEMQTADSPTSHAIRAIRFETLAEAYARVTDTAKSQVMLDVQDKLEVDI
jgi:hypothetical protein